MAGLYVAGAQALTAQSALTASIPEVGEQTGHAASRCGLSPFRILDRQTEDGSETSPLKDELVGSKSAARPIAAVLPHAAERPSPTHLRDLQGRHARDFLIV